MHRLSLFLSAGTVAILFATAARADDDHPAQQEKSFEKEVTIKVKLNYLLYLPKGYDADAKQAWPLILFLHGAGESGDDLAKVKQHGPPKLVATQDLPFVVVSPQSPRMGWNVEALNALLDEVIASHRVDKDRVYLTGLSMGGYGTWALAAAHPEKFAAIAPICGGGDPKTAAKLKNLPIWDFHGAKDSVVQLARSKDMVNAIEAAGGHPKFTVYPEANHDSWTETYNNPALFEWFLAQRRGAPSSAEAASPDAWVELFDGKTLEGWMVRGGQAHYEVKDGAIVGTTVEGSPNTFLCKGDFRDFELELEVKCDPRLNSGVQVRSHIYTKDDPEPANQKRAGVVYGPQCEIARQETGTAGRFYDEGRRGRWLADIEPAAKETFQDDGWNRYRIVVQGNRYRSWVNGVACSDFTDDVDSQGFIGLQVHGIAKDQGPFEVRWRNVRLRPLGVDGVPKR